VVPPWRPHSQQAGKSSSAVEQLKTLILTLKCFPARGRRGRSLRWGVMWYHALGYPRLKGVSGHHLFIDTHINAYICVCYTLQSVCLQAAADMGSLSLPWERKMSQTLPRKERRILKSTQKVKGNRKKRTDVQLEMWGHEVLFFFVSSHFATCLSAWPSSCPFLLPACFPAACCTSPVPGNLLQSPCVPVAGG